MSRAFYRTEKSIKTPFTSFIEDYSIVGLKNYNIWILFGNGTWVLYDGLQNKVVSTDAIQGDHFKYSHIIQSPRAMKGEKVVFANTTDLLSLQVLNPFNKTYEDGWYLPTPTLEACKERGPNDVSKVDDAVNNIKLVTLDNANKVALYEKKGNDCFITVAERGTKDTVSALLQSNSRTYCLVNVNETDMLMLYAENQGNTLYYSLWDLNKAKDGFVNYEVKLDFSLTAVGASGWGNDQLVFVGNSSDKDNTQAVVVTPGKDTAAEVKDIDCVGAPHLLLEVVDIDRMMKKILVVQNASPPVLGLYDGHYNQVEFRMLKKEESNSFQVSGDKRFIMEFSGLGRDEDLKKESETKVAIYGMPSKQRILLHLFTKARVEKDKTLMQYYGNPYVAKQVFDMFSE